MSTQDSTLSFELSSDRQQKRRYARHLIPGQKFNTHLFKLLRITIVALSLLIAAPANAKDLLDWVIGAVDPTLEPARPLIECLAGGGSAAACAAEAAQHQASGILPIGPDDDRIKKIVAVFDAARREDWLKVINVGGEAVAKVVACGVLPVQGPAKQPACNIVIWVINNNFKLIDDAYAVLKGPDWWAVVNLLGTDVCQFIPGDGAAGAAKDIVCGAFGEVLQTAKQVADEVSNALVAGSDAVENLLFGDDSHMPYDKYYALYWQPWYQYATAQSVEGQPGVHAIASKIWHPCVDYFDSHNQYRSTARKTCDDMRDKRFQPEVAAFARALPVAVDGYYDTVARPAIRAAVLASFGKPSSQDLPGQKFFVQNCAFQMRKLFPFPEPDDTRCQILLDKSKTLPPQFGPAFEHIAAQCFADVKMQNIQPTVWTRSCEGMEFRYSQDFASESLRLIIQLGELKNKGCIAPDKEAAAKSGLLVTCDNFPGNARCLSIFQRDGKKYCKADVPPIVIPKKPKTTIPLPGKKPAMVIPMPGSRPDTPTIPKPGKLNQPQKRIPLPENKPTKIPLPANKPAIKNTPKIEKPAFSGTPFSRKITPITIEAETLVVRGKSIVRGGKAVAQPMSRFGKSWSGGKQLFWSGGQQNSTLDLVVNITHAGAFTVELYMTRAPDYGKLKFDINGKPSKKIFDGYARAVSGPVKVILGSYQLKAGKNRIRATVIGLNKLSRGYYVGIDKIRLVHK